MLSSAYAWDLAIARASFMSVRLMFLNVNEGLLFKIGGGGGNTGSERGGNERVALDMEAE